MLASANIPLSLYVHIPWCVRKCPYCDFNSHESKGELPEIAYINALLDDLDEDLIFVSERSLTSIFIGGGTPSLFSAEAIRQLLKGIEARVAFSPSIEITLEANPGTLEAGRFSGFREAGVNRLSIGVQSFDDGQLKKLGRIHQAAGAVAAIESAKAAGFDNFNVDLMYGLPNQGVKEALEDIRQAQSFVPSHLSWYQLTLEPNTRFHFNPPALLPNDDLLADIMDEGQKLLAGKGYQQYEISAYGKPGKQAKHNVNYWQFGDYLGIGAGAHGKVTRDDGKILRRAKQRQPERYLDKGLSFINTERELSELEIPVEFMLNVLRLNSGISNEILMQRAGLSEGRMQHYRAEATERGLLEPDPDRWQPTDFGLRFLNDLLAIFQPN